MQDVSEDYIYLIHVMLKISKILLWICFEAKEGTGFDLITISDTIKIQIIYTL